MEVDNIIDTPPDINQLNICLFSEAVADRTVQDNTSLIQMVRGIKSLFVVSPSKTLPHIKIEHLLENAISLQNTTSKTLESDFLCNYGTSLIAFIGRDACIDERLLKQIQFVLFELDKQKGELGDKLISDLWCKLEENSIFHFEFMQSILKLSKSVIEEFVLQWVEESDWDKFFVTLSTELPDLYQLVTRIFNQVLIKTNGHQKILERITSYVTAVMSACEKEGKDFFRLYPIDCRRLVTLLIISPDVYPEMAEDDKNITKNVVLELLLDKFKENRQRTLLLLSHYPLWMNTFKSYLECKVSTWQG